jgi:hypothetical protein
MIWLTWRQFRAQALSGLAVLAVFAVMLAVTGLHLAHLYDISGIGTCHSHGDCGPAANSFLSELNAANIYPTIFNIAIGVLLLAPAIIGIFWGAPLIARELEAGTFRLAWNQSVTRSRWLAVKLAATGLASMAAAGLLSLMLAWWAGPLDRAAALSGDHGRVTIPGRFEPLIFATRGITPIGYAAFAFVLGVAAGVLIRRTVPAMAITLAVFAAVQIAMPFWIRPHLIAPAHVTSALNTHALTQLTNSSGGAMTVTGGVTMPGAWILSNQSVNAAGQVFTGPAPQPCLSQTGSMQACMDALARLHLRQYVVYQPASRYWDFQWIETGIFIALALLLAGSCFWLVRRRLF